MDCAGNSRYSVLECMILDEGEKPTYLPLSVLKEITNDFSCEREIGRGGFAVVYKGVLGNGTIAVKKLSNTHMHEKKFHREVECLMKMKHKNIVRFLGYCADTQGKTGSYNGKFVMAEIQERLLCFEYLTNGSLQDYIKDAFHGLEWRICYQIIKGICEGLHCLHQNHIFHLDLKPANILLDSNMLPKIADFGLSKYFDEKESLSITSKMFGSMGYIAPEYYSGRITLKVDMYSLGVIITEILTGEKGYFNLESVLEIWKNRSKTSQGDIMLEQVKICAEIGTECIESNPQKRPDTQQIIDRLHQVESKNRSIETGIIGNSLVARAYDVSNDELHLGTPKEGGETNSPEVSKTEKFDPTPIAPKHGSNSPGNMVDNFTIDTLHAATEGFSDDRLIGSSSFGLVYCGTLPRRARGSNQAGRAPSEGIFAVLQELHRKRETAYKWELTEVTRAKHRNTVCLVGCCSESGERMLVYEYMMNGTLHDRAPMAPALLSWRGRLAVALDATRGIEYMHVYALLPMIHRNIKSANILLDDSWTAKIASFGMSVPKAGAVSDGDEDGSNLSHPFYIDTGGYMDPECYMRLTDKSDVYSFSMILLELISSCRVMMQRSYAGSVTLKNLAHFTLPHILADDVKRVLDPRLPAPTPHEVEALAYVGYLAAQGRSQQLN